MTSTLCLHVHTISPLQVCSDMSQRFKHTSSHEDEWPLTASTMLRGQPFTQPKATGYDMHFVLTCTHHQSF